MENPPSPVKVAGDFYILSPEPQIALEYEILSNYKAKNDEIEEKIWKYEGKILLLSKNNKIVKI